MGWIVTGLANLFLELISDLICWIIKVTLDMDINIGYDPGKPLGSLFDKSYVGSSNVEGLFDKVFPVMEYFIDVFLFLGYAMVIIITIYKLYETMISDSRETPGRIVAGFFYATGGVTFSYSIFIYLEQIASKIFKEFQDAAAGMLKDSGITESKDVFNAVDLLNNDEMFANQSDMGFTSDLTMIFIMITCFVALLFQLIRLFAEVYERYVVLGVLFYTCPMAFATLVSKSSSDIFTRWRQMVVSQFILMFMNLFFLSVFSGAMGKIFDNLEKNHYAFADDKEFIVTIMLLIGWLTVGQKVDEHLRALGLSVSQSGHGLATAILTGTTVAKGAIKAVTSPMKRGAEHAAGAAVKKGATAASSAAKSAVAGTAAGNALGSITGRGAAQVVNEAERANGKLTPSGAKAIMATEGAQLKGPEVKDGCQALGIDPDSKDFNTAVGKDGSLHNKHADADWNQSIMGNGLATIKDSTGSTISEFGDASRYEVPDGCASKQIETESGLMTYAATPDIVSADCNNMLNSVNASPQYGTSAGVTWSKNGDGTISGVDESGGRWQAAPTYLATANPSVGKTSTGTVNGMQYTVQKLNETEPSGFASVKPAASSPLLQRKTSQQQTARRVGQSNARRFIKK
ncbi:type IV secretion system protein [Anaerovoracaceae bacterium 42-11]